MAIHRIFSVTRNFNYTSTWINYRSKKGKIRNHQNQQKVRFKEKLQNASPWYGVFAVHHSKFKVYSTLLSYGFRFSFQSTISNITNHMTVKNLPPRVLYFTILRFWVNFNLPPYGLVHFHCTTRWFESYTYLFVPIIK